MSALSPDRASAIAFELQYWRGLLEEGAAVNQGIPRAAEHVAQAVVALMSTLTAPESARHGFVLDGMNACNAALAELHGLQMPLDEMLTLISGRLAALRAEVDDE